MNFIIIAIIAAVVAGGTYVVMNSQFQLPAPNTEVLETDSSSSTEGMQAQQTAVGPTTSNPIDPVLVGALAIVDSRMYYNAPSYVTVRNTGTDEIIVHRISFGQVIVSMETPLHAGEQQQIPFTQANGAIGSKYVLQVQGESASSGKIIAAQTSAILRAPVSKVETSYSQLDVTVDGTALLRLTLFNSGMDDVSIISIECDRPIASRLWASDDGRIPLQPGEHKDLNIMLDSQDCIFVKRQNPDGTFGFPQSGSTKQLAIIGENSVGHAVSAVVVVPVVVGQAQEASVGAAGTTSTYSGTELPMTGATVLLDSSSSQYTLSFVVTNNLSRDVIVDSLKVNGLEVPGWNGLNILAGATITAKVSTSQGISEMRAGSIVQVVVQGQLADSGGSSAPVYAAMSAQVRTP
ncbi:MAG TPA: hypothetical protein VJP79_06245 [Nitrososphaera sp.]|nr:hypothetical protein [Nitrososphaera sp.]